MLNKKAKGIGHILNESGSWSVRVDFLICQFLSASQSSHDGISYVFQIHAYNTLNFEKVSFL